jgi:long-chain fatty acid transport protein
LNRNLRSVKPLIVLATGAGLCSFAGSAAANGYHFLHQSAEGFGTAYAANGTAINDISAMFSNPASITRFDGFNLSTSATLDFPRSNLTNVSATAAFTGAPISGVPASPSQPIDTAEGAATYASYQLNDKIHFGVSFTAPYAYVSEYPRAAASRYTATLTKLFAYNLNPVVAWKVDEKLSLAVGLNLQIYHNDLNTMVPTDYNNPSPQSDVETKIEATEVSYGFTLGMEYQFSADTRIGASYRSKIDHDFDGDLKIVGQLNNLDALRLEIPALTSMSGSADFSITTPSMLQFGLLHKLSEKWELYGNANLTGWHAFKDTHITFSNGFPDVTVDNDWDDSWYVALGAGYQWSDKIKLRAGFAYDWSPTPEPAVSPRAPNNDRLYGAFGMSYQMDEAWKFDFGYMYILFREAHIRLADGNNTPRGTLNGDLDLYANVFTFQLNHKF